MLTLRLTLKIITSRKTASQTLGADFLQRRSSPALLPSLPRRCSRGQLLRQLQRLDRRLDGGERPEWQRLEIERPDLHHRIPRTRHSVEGALHSRLHAVEDTNLVERCNMATCKQ